MLRHRVGPDCRPTASRRSNDPRRWADALEPPPVLVSGGHGTTITATRAEPDPRLGPPGTHRRLDRPPARGHRSADPDLQARAGTSSPARSRTAPAGADFDDEIDLRAEDDALIAAELDAAEAERAEEDERVRRRRATTRTTSPSAGAAGAAAAARRAARRPTPLEATFDHGEEGYGLWLDPAVQDDPVYAEYWAGHRPVEVTIEEDQIVIRRAGGDESDDDSDDDDGRTTTARRRLGPPRPSGRRPIRRPPP